MVGNDYAVFSLQVISLDALEKKYTRTIGNDKLNTTLFKTPQSNTLSLIDAAVRNLYTVSTNTYKDTNVIGKVNLTESIAG